MFTIWTRGLSHPKQIGFCGPLVTALANAEKAQGRIITTTAGIAIYETEVIDTYLYRAE